MMVHERKNMFKQLSKMFLVAFAAVAVSSSASTAYASYADKVDQDPGDHIEYKKPSQKSYTGPFDYQNRDWVRPAAPAPKSAGCNCFTFDATKSYDVDGQKLSIFWDFGDGATSTDPVVTHCFEKAGDYNVTLTVKDNSGMTCDTGVTTTRVSPNFAPMANAGPEVKACLGETVTFDASASQVQGASKYTWDFGDGTTGEGMKVSHAYEKAGSYRVLLTIDDGKGTNCSVGQAVTSAWIADRPTVQIQGPDWACTGQTVTFDAPATGGSLKYHWDFGDGETWDGGSHASHAYQKGGNYNVLVTVDNGQGFACSTASAGKPIKINSRPTVPAGENLNSCVGQTIVFDGSGATDPDGDPLTYAWDFGDGSTSNEAKPAHVYEKSGNYRVIFTVKDSSGSDCGVNSTSYNVVVNTKPEAAIEVR